jgi:hypothetical protein
MMNWGSVKLVSHQLGAGVRNPSDLAPPNWSLRDFSSKVGVSLLERAERAELYAPVLPYLDLPS